MRRFAIVVGLSLLAAACSGSGGGGTDGGTDAGTQSPFDAVEASVQTSIPGLQGPVEVLRDAWGVAHVYCTVDADCFRAEGYVQAYDRLFEMDFYRHVARGELGGFFGTLPGVRGMDRYLRRMFTALDGTFVPDVMAAGLSGTELEMGQAFTDGINAYIDDLDDKPWTQPSPEYESGAVYGGQVFTGQAKPAHWTLSDSLAIGRLFSFQLSGGGFEEELTRGMWAAVLSSEDFAVLQSSAPIDNTFVLPGYYGGQPLASPPRISPAVRARMQKLAPFSKNVLEALAPVTEMRKVLGPNPGSNDWILAPGGTSTGNPLVSNDPHLELDTPSVWWTVNLDSVSMPGATGSLDAEGNAFPGVPVLLIGHTNRIAWGVTTVGYDVIDAYTETVTGVDTVAFQGGDSQVQKVVVKMPKGSGPNDFDQEKICIVPHHGPIMAVDGMTDDQLADPNTPCVDPSVGSGTALVAKWTGQTPTDEISAFHGLLYAQNVDDAQAAIAHFQVGAQNFVVGDADGNILYDPHATVPIRDNWQDNPPYLPLPGDGSAEWTGAIADADLPHVKNPEKGFVVTANNDLVGFTEDNNVLNDPYYFYFTDADGLRAGRITKLLGEIGAGQASPDDMKTIQYDTYWQLGALLAPYITQAAAANAGLVTSLGVGDSVARIEAWTNQKPTGLKTTDTKIAAVPDAAVRSDSIATTIFARWLYPAHDRTFADEEAQAGLITGTHVSTGQESLKALYFVLLNGDDRWFDDVSTPSVTETRADVLLGALQDAQSELASKIDPDPNNWLWGRIHINDFPSAIGQVGYDPYAMPSVANKGAISTINPANFGRSFRVGSGASMRIVSDVDPSGVLASMILPGGEVDQTDSANRADQLPLWLAGEYVDFPFTLDAALEAASSREASGLKPGARWSFTP